MIPTAVWSGSFKLFGMDIRCHVLDNGQRVIESADVLDLLEGKADIETGAEMDEDCESFVRWMRGMKDVTPS